MQIGRKIYYELSTGNVIVDTGERQGDVVETTETQDLQMYVALQPYQQSAVGVLQLSFGQDAQNFQMYNYHINTTTQTIVWDTTNSSTLAGAKQTKIAQLNDQCNQTISAGFTSSALSVAHTYPFDNEAQRNLQGSILDTLIDSTVTTISFKTLDAGYLDHTVDQLKQLGKDSKVFLQNNLTKYNQLKAQVNSATTIGAANAVTW